MLSPHLEPQDVELCAILKVVEWRLAEEDASRI